MTVDARKPTTRPRGPAWALIAVLGLSACASNGPASTVEELGPDLNTWGFGRRFPHDPNSDEFTFGPGDEMVLQIPDLPELSGSYVIRSDGKITVPLLNDVLVGGLTPTNVRRLLRPRLAIFLRNPDQAIISPGAIVSKKYFVAASGETGGLAVQSVDLVGDVTLFDAWVAMGSPSSPLDDETHLTLFRGDPRQPRKLVINMQEIMTKGKMGGNLRIQPDDIIYVPPTFLGHLRSALTGITAPFEGLFRLTSTAFQLDATARLLQGENVGLRRGTGF